MAAVMAPYQAPRPASPSKTRPSKHQSGKSSHSGAPAPSDIYYGHEETAKMCARFISALFSCPDTPPAPSVATNPPAPAPSLAVFVAYALHRTRLHSSVTFSALFLLSRLKSRFPAARGSSGHRLFISAFMIASKVVCDDTYSNKSWCVVGQAMFSLKEINQMEREMCSYLEWILHVEAKELQEFETRVRRDYGAGGPAPTYVPVTMPPTRASSSVAVPPVPTSPTRAPPPRPARESYPSPVSTPPSPSLSNSTSPASSTCHTPPSTDDSNAVIVAPGSTHPLHQSGGPVVKSKSPDVAIARHRESAFAFAAPTVW